MTYLILFFALIFSNQAYAKKRFAITLDDSPRFARGYFDGPTRAEKLIETLQKAQTGPVVFFSNSKNADKEGWQRLKKYAKAGHYIANHTHSHPDFNKTSLSDYRKDFMQAHTELSKLPNYRKWFRFPFLREGNTIEKRDGMRKALKEMGYQNAYVTLDNYDWYLESLFQKAYKENPKLDLEKMKAFYIQVMVNSINYYDRLALKHIGRSPAHILLLHEMDITALFLDDLLAELKKQNWEIISLEEALQDDISKFKIKKAIKYNPGRIGEIAFEKGQKKGLWPEYLNEKYLDKEMAKINQTSKRVQ